MKPEAQRIAVATACGWSRKPEHDYHNVSSWAAGKKIEMWGKSDGCLTRSELIPDYLNDLNAMHEAEEFLLENHRQQWGRYWHSLEKTIGTPTDRELQEIIRCLPFNRYKIELVEVLGGSHYCATGLAMHATAAQRAEAFLRTLNLWTE